MTTQQKIVFLSPEGEVPAVAHKEVRALEGVEGKTVGFLFNGHHSAADLWKFLQSEMADQYHPGKTLDLWKSNLAAPAPRPMVQQLVEQADAAVVGVGA